MSAFYDAGDLDLAGGLGFALDAHLLEIQPGAELVVRSSAHPSGHEIPVWCRANGHELVSVDPDAEGVTFRIRRGASMLLRFADRPDWGMHAPTRDGEMHTADWLVGRAGEVPPVADPSTGFAARGAVVETGAPDFGFTVVERDAVWAANVASLYEQATATRWDVSRDVPWEALEPLPDHLERAVCQIMTNLAENEYAALYVPAKFIPRIHPHYVEVVLFLTTHMADESRHIEAFTKRALVNGGALQLSSASTQASLKSLYDQEDFSIASFLLSVLGEGTFLDLLAFIERHAPDPVTAEIVKRARADESRHVAFGVEHARQWLAEDRERAEALRAAVRDRAAYMAQTSGANPYVEEALVLLAAGGVRPERIRDGVVAVRTLHDDMHRHRVGRLMQLGFTRQEAGDLSELHTPNFM